MNKFNHIDANGNAVMVDITEKKNTQRVAIAACSVIMHRETLKAIVDAKIKKGDVLSVAQLAGIMGAKKTADLIPLCHPLNLTSTKVELKLDRNRSAIDIQAICKISGPTGVEMEALTAISVAALTVYDMCKGIDREIQISNIRLLHKSGGKSSTFNSNQRNG